LYRAICCLKSSGTALGGTAGVRVRPFQFAFVLGTGGGTGGLGVVDGGGGGGGTGDLGVVDGAGGGTGGLGSETTDSLETMSLNSCSSSRNADTTNSMLDLVYL
tara:strand:+ start:128 stop:439 length:312 start_codon:yes stop_codon:yes gene_type:complete